MKLGKTINHKITIEPTQNHSFYVRVGCGRFAFQNGVDLLGALGEYLDNPEKWEKEYNEVGGGPQTVAADRNTEVPQDRPSTRR